MRAPLWPQHRQPELEPIDYRILHLQFLGRTPHEIARALKRTDIDERLERPAYQAMRKQTEESLLQQIIHSGDFEPLTIAKANAPKAMQRIVQQSERERDPRTRLAANQTVLKYAGIEPPRRLEITTPDRVIDQMTAQELEDLATRRLWPARFREVLRAFLPAPPLQPAIDVTPVKRTEEHDPGPQGDQISPDSLKI